MRKAILVAVFVSSGAITGCSSHFGRAIDAVGRNDAIVLEGAGGAKVLVSPRFQGRIMDTTVGKVDRVGFVCFPELAEGETHKGFNNFGGQDRFWIGPEAGKYGIYFEPGAKFDRAIWQVPADFDKGAFTVVEKTSDKVRFHRDMKVTNYQGTKYQVKVEREVGLVPAAALREGLGVDLPAGVSFAGSYSDNIMTNAGPEKWTKETGLLNIWILGQFDPGPRTVIIAPFKPGAGPAYRDEPYFGKVSEARLKTVGSAVVLKADAYAEGKVGIPQARTPGVAGSFDFDRDLLIVIKFDVPAEPALYADSAWKLDVPDPYGGDLFQTYNSNRTTRLDERYAFYELESVSPSRELAPGESVRHRQFTYCFQGDHGKLQDLAKKILGVDLEEVRKAMF